MSEQNTSDQTLPTIEEIREEFDDDKFSSGAYHRPFIESQKLPPTDRAPQEHNRNKGIYARPQLEEFVPPELPVESNNPKKQKRNAEFVHLVLELGIPEEYVDKYYVDKYPGLDGGYAAEDVSGVVVAVEKYGEVEPPEPDED